MYNVQFLFKHSFIYNLFFAWLIKLKQVPMYNVQFPFFYFEQSLYCAS